MHFRRQTIHHRVVGKPDALIAHQCDQFAGGADLAGLVDAENRKLIRV
jgi:hypothetical protein